MESKTEPTINTLKAHLAINVRSVEKSIEFYKQMLGIEPAKVRPGYAKFDVQNPPLNLTLNEAPFTDSGALSHLGIQVAATSDVLAQRDKWVAAGLITRDEMQTNCCYAVQDKTWVHDPDGNEWEVFVVLEDNLAETATCCGIVAAEKSESMVGTETSSGNERATSTAVAASTAEASCGCGAAPAVETVASSCCAPAAAPVPLSR
jgi:catechol 2,3-dioxygenase-like lactoylglutathione lyase family enzyme